ncbi:universal stress protein [Telluria beijingensis]|uniref:universal stress protein n=1 Tax=Telluria beijingensis TaxID=3068633 RepID=UPI00279567E1|nr:universal stress protein [Massilia sp. REN29]
MVQRILVPTDGSDLSKRAAMAAIDLAKRVGAELVAMTATPEFHAITANPEMLEQTREQYARSSRDSGQHALDQIADAARAAGVPCTCVQVVSDAPHDAIIAAAREHRCDLIAMASHGRRGIKGLLLGSETQKVLVHGAIPVLVCR